MSHRECPFCGQCVRLAGKTSAGRAHGLRTGRGVRPRLLAAQSQLMEEVMKLEVWVHLEVEGEALGSVSLQAEDWGSTPGRVLPSRPPHPHPGRGHPGSGSGLQAPWIQTPHPSCRFGSAALWDQRKGLLVSRRRCCWPAELVWPRLGGSAPGSPAACVQTWESPASTPPSRGEGPWLLPPPWRRFHGYKACPRLVLRAAEGG